MRPEKKNRGTYRSFFIQALGYVRIYEKKNISQHLNTSRRRRRLLHTNIYFWTNYTLTRKMDL